MTRHSDSTDDEILNGAHGKLEWNISVMNGHGVLMVKTAGEHDPESTRAMAKAILAVAERHGCQRFLVDAARSNGRFGVVQIYNSPGVLKELGLTPAAKTAVVLPGPHKDGQFLKNVCRTACLDVAIFYDEPTALVWLTKQL